MTTQGSLLVRVNEELVLDAGAWEEVSGTAGSERIIRPAKTTLFRQVLDYLRVKPDPPTRPRGSAAGREGMAAAAVALRWGSYLAVLLDRDKPISPPTARAGGTSRICDEEMARINIEVSAALAEWIDVYRADDSGRVYDHVVNRAVAYLPMQGKAARLKGARFAALADPEIGARLVAASDPARVARVRADAEHHPTRLFANALANVAWRNGPVEDIHAGRRSDYPLDRRRVTPAEETELMASAIDSLAMGMTVCLQLGLERPRRPWAEQVLPFGLAHMWRVTPRAWTLTGTSCDVRLPRSDPEPAPSPSIWARMPC